MRVLIKKFYYIKHQTFDFQMNTIYDINMKLTKNNNIIFSIFLLIGLVFLFWKAKYGFIYNDEPFLLGLGYRLVNGDAMIANEWSVMSIVSYLIYPFMFVYNLFNPTTEGIAMFGRYCFIIIWSITIIFVYIRLKKYGVFTILACMIFYLFAPLDMMTLSYNSFALSSLLITSTLLLTAKSKFDLILIGIFFSIAVISIPFLLIVYIILSIIALISYFSMKSLRLNENYNFVKGWIYISLGSGFMLLIFFMFIFSKISLNTFFNNLKYFEIANSEHVIPNVITVIYSYINNVFLRFKEFILSSFITILICIFDKKRQRHSMYYLIAILIILMSQYWYLYLLSNTYPRMNLIAVPLTIYGVIIFILTKKRNYQLFLYFFVLSIFYSFIINVSSNLGIMAISSMFIISSFGSSIIVYDFYNEIKQTNKENKKFISILLILCILLQLLNQIYYRYKYYYMDKEIKELNFMINVGPGAGTIVTQDRAVDYIKNYNQIKNITFDIKNNDEFVFLEHIPWYFLINNTKWATYSTWGYWINGGPDIVKTLEVNMMYYEENPNKFPTYVLLMKENKSLVNDFILILESKGYLVRESMDFLLYYK